MSVSAESTGRRDSRRRKPPINSNCVIRSIRCLRIYGVVALFLFAFISCFITSESFSATPQPRTQKNVRNPSAGKDNKTIRPVIKEPLNRKLREAALKSIWYHTKPENKEKNPREALRILELLLKDEKSSGKLKVGVVFNVLKSCQKELDSTSIGRLERVLMLLEQNDGLWDPNMLSFALVALSRSGKPDRAETLLNRLSTSGHPSVMQFNAILDGYAKKAKVTNVERVIKRMETLHQSGELVDGPNAASFTCLINALSRSRLVDAPVRATEVVNRMEQMDDKRAQPSLISYTTLLRCYANRGMVDDAEKLLSKMYDRHKAGELDKAPDNIAIKCVADAKRKLERKDSSRKFTNIHDDTKRLLEASVGTFDRKAFRSAADAIWFHINQNSNKRDGAEKSLLLLVRLLEEEKAQAVRPVLTKGIVFNVLRACQQYAAGSADKIEYALNMLEQQNSLWDSKVLTETLVTLVKCQDENNTPERAEAILTRTNLPLNNFHFCAVLNGYAKRGLAKKAERLLNRIDELKKSGVVEEGPNIIAYNCVLDAFVKTNENNAVERAESLYNKMEKSNDQKPDMFTYTSMLNLYAKHAMGDKADRLLERIVALQDAGKIKGGPNSFSYRCAIDALAKDGEARRAEQLLVRMRERNMRPNAFHYTGVLSGYARECKPLEAERVLQQMEDSFAQKHLKEMPNAVAYNCVMHAWAKSGEVDAPFRARACVDHMIEAGVVPNVITYNCLLCACGNRGMAKECELLLKQMHELYSAGDLEAAPNTISYNYALDSLARSGDRVWTVLRAEALVNKMKELNKTGQADTKPNMITYRSLLKCYANWNLVQDAECLLERMQKLYDAGKLEYGPDKVSFQVVIDALTKSDEEGTTERAENLKVKFEKIYGDNKGWQQEALIELDQVGALLEYMNAT